MGEDNKLLLTTRKEIILFVLLLRILEPHPRKKCHMRREELGQPVLTLRTRSQAAYTTLSVMHCTAVNCELK